MKIHLILLLTLLCFITHSQTPKLVPIKKGTNINLFNEKNLEGWYQISDKVTNDKELFGVDNNTIHVYPNQTENTVQAFGALITTTEYKNYVLTLEYKWGNKKFKPRDNFVRDAGVLIHVSGKDEVWPSGIECQIQEGDTGDLWIIKSRASSKVHPTNRNYDENGLVNTLGTRETEYNRFSRSYCWEKPDWNKVVLVVNEDSAKFYVNDKLVNEAINMKKWNEAEKKWLPLTQGKILLQAEGSEIFYRNISLKSLDDNN